MAADSQLTWDDSVPGHDPKKIVILNPMTVFAGAGQAGDILKMAQFYAQPKWEGKLDEIPKVSNKFEALLFSKGQLYYLSGRDYPVAVYDNFHAIGSGWKFAYSAMAFGTSAPDAVKFAAKYDIYTKEPVIVVNVQNIEEAPRKGRRAPRVPPPEA